MVSTAMVLQMRRTRPGAGYAFTERQVSTHLARYRRPLLADQGACPPALCSPPRPRRLCARSGPWLRSRNRTFSAAAPSPLTGGALTGRVDPERKFGGGHIADANSATPPCRVAQTG